MDKSFIEMIKQNEGVIFKVASFYANESQPLADLYQEIVINLWTAFPKFRNESKFSTWMYRIALNTCISQLRKKKNYVVYVDFMVEIPESVENNEFIKELYRIIDQLGQLEKALVLLYLEDKSHKEISEIMGISVTNVATKLCRIKDKMKQMSNIEN